MLPTLVRTTINNFIYQEGHYNKKEKNKRQMERKKERDTSFDYME